MTMSVTPYGSGGGSASANTNWLAPVATRADLPMTGNSDGDTRMITDENVAVTWDDQSGVWVDIRGDVYIRPITGIPVSDLDQPTQAQLAQAHSHANKGEIDRLGISSGGRLTIDGVEQAGGGGEMGPHTHPMSDVNGLADALATKADVGHSHPEYAAVDHTHAGINHANRVVLDALGDDAGQLTYNGQPISGSSGGGGSAVVPRARVGRTSNQVIPMSAATKVLFTQEVLDSDNMADVAVDGEHIVINTPGTYMITANALWQNNSNGLRRTVIGKVLTGGTTKNIGWTQANTVGGTFFPQTVTILEQLVAGEKLYLEVYHTSTVDIPVMAGSAYPGQTALHVVRVSG